jgi:DNA replication protein DnaC
MDGCPREYRNLPCKRDAQGRPCRVPAAAGRWEPAIELMVLTRWMPPTVARVLLDGCQENGAVLAVNTWLPGSRRGLVLRGGVGVGKSVAAGHAIRVLLKEQRAQTAVGDAVSWHRPASFVTSVLHSYSEQARALGSMLVVLDDLGLEARSDLSEALATFIDESAARFLITTNLGKAEFAARYDRRVIDRLNHCAIAIDLAGGSMRQQNGRFADDR